MKTERMELGGKTIILFVGANSGYSKKALIEVVEKLTDYRLVNPVRSFTNTFAIDEDLLLMNKTTRLFWSTDNCWSSDLTKAVREGSKTQLRKLIPWYEDLVEQFYKLRYKVDKGYGSNLDLEVLKGKLNEYQIVCQSKKLNLLEEL